MRKKLIDSSKMISFAGWFLLVLAVILFIASLILQNESIQLRFADVKQVLREFEFFVISLENKWMIFLVIEILFLVRTVFPIPISIIVVISGAVFSSVNSFIMCMIGLTVQLLIGYFWGRNKDGGRIFNLISRFELVEMILEQNGRGNPWVLFISRFIPFFSVNIVSKIYGNYNFDCSKFITISLCGMLPKIISLIWFGRNIYNPFTVEFFIPIIILLIISGLAILVFNAITKLVKKSKKGEDRYEYSE